MVNLEGRNEGNVPPQDTQNTKSPNLKNVLAVTWAILVGSNALPVQANDTDKICGIISAQEIQRMTRSQLDKITDNLRTTHPHLSKQDRRACETEMNTVYNNQVTTNYNVHNANIESSREQNWQAWWQLYANNPNFRKVVDASLVAGDKVIYIDKATGKRIDPKTWQPIE